jgi:KUP system potassium uptake protein
VVSLIFWALTIIVSVKYAGFIMRAHNRGDGGIMALTALVTRLRVPRGAVLVILGVFGAGLFFGDGMITPAISVISAVEGLNVATPSLAHLGVGLVIAFFMITWRRGREIVSRNRTQEEGSLIEFLDSLPTMQPPVRRVPGSAIHLNPGMETTPLALRAEVAHNHVLHEKVLSVSVESVGIPHVDDADRFDTKWMGHGLYKVAHVSIRTGYHDSADVPKALARARKQGQLPRSTSNTPPISSRG